MGGHRSQRQQEAPELPTERDINVYDSLDERTAVKNFLGKTLQQAEEMFRNGGSQLYTEDLMWMGPNAFCYYVRAAVDCLKSDASAGDWYMLCGFCTAVEYQLKYYRPAIETSVPLLREALAYVLSSWAKFGPDIPDESELLERYRALLPILGEAQQ
jgi:hypothetical protein